MAHFLVMIPFAGTSFWNKLNGAGTLNADGQPSFESIGGPSAEEINQTAKTALSQVLCIRSILEKVLQHPGDLFFKRLGLYARVALPVLGSKNIFKSG